jgi:protocatechuate 3,4-dioxygenase beta subunit
MTQRTRLALGVLAAALVAGVLVTWGRAPGARPALPRAESQPVAAGPAALDEIATADAPLDGARPEGGDRRSIAAESGSIEPEERADGSSGTLRVLVRSRDTGEPVGDVRLLLVPTGTLESSSTHIVGAKARLGESPVTGADGLAELEVEPGQRYLLKPLPHGFFCEGVNDVRIKALAPRETRDIALELPALDALLFVGRVVAADTDQPLAGASVTVAACNLSGRNRTTADADGYFEARVPSAGAYYAMAETPGFARGIAGIVRGHESRAEAVVFRLHRSAQLSVLVLARDGTPLERVQVQLNTDPNNVNQSSSPADRVRIGNLVWSGLTGADGRCSVRELPPFVPLEVECWQEGGMRNEKGDPLHLDPGEVREAVFRIGTGATIAGLIDGSEGSEGIRIWLVRAEAGVRPRYLEEYEMHSAETVTAAGGGFEFADVPDGTWLVGFAPGGPYPTLTEIVEVVDGVAGGRVYLGGSRGLHIEGLVVDRAGAPIEGASVQVTAQGAPGSLGDDTDENGAFSVGPLEPGAFSVYASEVGYTDSGVILANAGDRGILLQLHVAGSLRGRLMSEATGAPVEGLVTVSLVRRSEPWSGWLTTRTDEQGEFDFDGLEPGLYQVVASTEEGECAFEGPVAVVAGSQAAETLLEARPGARLLVRYGGSQPYVHFRAELDGAIVAADRIQAGSQFRRTVPAGTIRVECFEAPGVHEVALAAGEEKELVLGGGE